MIGKIVLVRHIAATARALPRQFGKQGLYSLPCSADSLKTRQAVAFVVVDNIFKRQVAHLHIAVSVVIAKDKLHIVEPRFWTFFEN